MPSLSKSQVNRLGELLRRQLPIDSSSLALLQELRAGYGPPMAKAQALLRGRLRVAATARLKTINTIVEKLRREKTRLSEMQDMAGLRIVLEMTLGEREAPYGQRRLQIAIAQYRTFERDVRELSESIRASLNEMLEGVKGPL